MTSPSDLFVFSDPDMDRWDRAFDLLATKSKRQIRAMALDQDMRDKLNAIVESRKPGGINGPERYRSDEDEQSTTED